MEEVKIICGQCNIDIVESEVSYVIKENHHDGEWFQCFDCYYEEEDYFYNQYAEEESYADYYCRTSCSCCTDNEPEQWDEEE